MCKKVERLSALHDTRANVWEGRGARRTAEQLRQGLISWWERWVEAKLNAPGLFYQGNSRELPETGLQSGEVGHEKAQ